MPRRILYEGNPPEWLKKAVRRERRRIGLEDWTVVIVMKPQEWLASSLSAKEKKALHVYACSICDSDYQVATIYFDTQITNGPEAISTIRHELLHARYQVICDAVSHACRVKPRLTAAQAEASIERVIEGLCESGVALLDKAYGP